MTRANRRHVIKALSAAMPIACLPPWARAQDRYPSRPVMLIVPQPVGAGPQVFAEQIARETAHWSGMIEKFGMRLD